ncbi:MAG: cofactor-independent phosphoglycerate mutase, partial [Elusimicrobia bacterium RIFOXYB2_FULL_49_7]
SLELAHKPYLDALARRGVMGLSCNVPQGMEPSSAVACMSLMGYDPVKYYSGRGPIEARSLGVRLNPGEVAFRCNVVTVEKGLMKSYAAGHITDAESHALIKTVNEKLGSDRVRFYPGVSYRHLMVVKNGEELLQAECTPPHDIPDKPVVNFLPRGNGSLLLNELMSRSAAVLKDHPVNLARIAAGKLPATTLWLFWGGRKVDDLPTFAKVYNKKAAMTSGVDLLRGIAYLAGIDILTIPGVTGGLDTDYAAQIQGALRALEDYDLVIVHVESPDESGHMGSLPEKIKSIEQIDAHMVKALSEYQKHPLRLLILPDHPTPVSVMTHTPDPVPFLLHGEGFDSSGAIGYSEAEGEKTGIVMAEGCSLMGKLVF